MKRTIFSNGKAPYDETLNFFGYAGKGTSSAALACPFFTFVEPINVLKKCGVSEIKLLVRLCEITSYPALREAFNTAGVTVKYFTEPTFHAKFYIVGQNALIGSANLTGDGMRKNRELSVVLDSDDSRFEELPGLFDELWSYAEHLTSERLEFFRVWRAAHSGAAPPPITNIEQVGPLTIDVASAVVSKERSYLKAFRQLYEERILPAHRQVVDIYSSAPERHPFFQQYDPKYEMDRFLYWVGGLVRTVDLSEVPIRSGLALEDYVTDRKLEWMSVLPEAVYHDESEIVRYNRLHDLLETKQSIADLSMENLTDMMSACNAFRAQDRFTQGGLVPLLTTFRERNSPIRIEKMLRHLYSGPGDYAQRLYDCVYDQSLKLDVWGRNSTLELFGWLNKNDIPPVNGRTTKALRTLGLDVPLL